MHFLWLQVSWIMAASYTGPKANHTALLSASVWCHLIVFQQFWNICISWTIRTLQRKTEDPSYNRLWKIGQVFGILWYRSILLHDLLSNVTDTVLYATLFVKFQNFFLKLWPFLKKFLNLTACFILYGHHQVLTLLWGGNCRALFWVLFLMLSHLWTSVSNSDGPLSLCVVMTALKKVVRFHK
jgi:hypothetical protein